MGTKRLKLARGLGDFCPVSVNFSDLQQEFGEDEEEFDPSDGGLEVEKLVDSLTYEEMITHILFNLSAREKVVFSFQLLRDGGYKIDHGSFAKAMGLSRSQYMRVLSDVRLKTALFVRGFKNQSL